MSGIGLLNEKPLHASLKAWYASPGARLEVPVKGFVIDLVQDDVLVEIQTAGFASIKEKLGRLTVDHRVRLVHPIPLEKWIVRPARDGSGGTIRRKSPKRGKVHDLFWQLVSFPDLLAHPNFALEVLLTREDEVRRYEGKRRWRNRGWAVEERRLLEVVERWLFERPADLRVLIPDALEEPFTTRELAEAIEGRRVLAQKMAYCLRRMGIFELVGRRGPANLYRLAGS